MNRRILCVDDEENVLRAFERTLRSQYELEIAVGSPRGLEAIKERGPFAVVVSDLRMPEMDGIQFLSEVRKHSPDTVRLMLSGNADLDAAIAAVNEGSIFQFLTKPCPADRLRGALDGALKQYQLITAERELLEQTLHGSVAMLAEVLSTVNPLAFSRASRLRLYVRHMAATMRLTNLWEFDLAAMLSQIGCIAVPSEVLEKLYTGRTLSPDEQKTYNSHPAIAHGLLAKIPRLEVVADIVKRQMSPFRVLKDSRAPEVVAAGAQMLLIATCFDEIVSRGGAATTALKIMQERPDVYQPALVAAIETAEVSAVEMTVKSIHLRDIQPGMVMNEDLQAKNGLFLVAKGQVISEALIARLFNFSRATGIKEPFTILVPKPREVTVEPLEELAHKS